MIADALIIGGAATALANDPHHATRDADARFVPLSPRATPPGVRLAIGRVPGSQITLIAAAAARPPP